MAHFEDPTESERKKIEKRMLDPTKVDFDKVGVIRQLVADNKLTSWGTVLSKAILNNFKRDLNNPEGKGTTPIMTNHPTLTGMIPIGMSFDTVMKENGETNILGDPVIELFGSFYVVDGVETVNMKKGWENELVAMTTENLAQKYYAGMIPGGSVGFTTQFHRCSTCGEKLSRYGEMTCDHDLGRKYDGKICVISVGETVVGSNKSDGKLKEFSMLVKGAVASAGGVLTYSDDGGFELKVDSEEDKKVDLRQTTLFYATNIGNGEVGDSQTKGETSSSETNKQEIDMANVTIDSSEYTDIVKKAATAELIQEKLDQGVKEYTELEGKFTELSGEVKQLKTEKTEFETKVSGLEEASTGYDEALSDMRTLAKETYVKAYGQTEQADLDSKYDEMGLKDLVSAYKESVEKFHETFSAEGSEGSTGKNTKHDTRSQRVAEYNLRS